MLSIYPGPQRREVNNEGFAIERAIQIGQWLEIGFVEGMGTTNEPQTYEFNDSLFNVVAEKCYYRLKQIDFDGTFQYSDEIEISLQPIITPRYYKPVRLYNNNSS